MHEEWRKFIIEWILPAGVFGVLMLFLFASFTANIKKETSDGYSEKLISITDDYSVAINNSVKNTVAVGQTVAGLINSGGLNKEAVLATLSQVVANTDAYMVAIVDRGGNFISEGQDSVKVDTLPYNDRLTDDAAMSKFFVSDDGVTGDYALVISILLDNTEYERLLIYYSMTGGNTRKYAPVETEYDPMGFAMIIDGKGTVYSSTGTNETLVRGKNFWDEIVSGINEATVSRVKTRMKSGAAGNVDGRINNREFVINYTPIGSSDSYLIVNFTKSNTSKQEIKLYNQSVKELIWCIVTVVLFILIVTTINVIQISTRVKSSKELIDKADTDLLTGMKNKIATEREIKEYISKNPDALAMLFVIDLDNFKKINDTMGHAFGDEVLRELGKNIGVNFRVSDVVGRTGGDEFTVFLKDLKEEANCIREAQKLVYFFRHFQVGDYVKYSVTASIGAAVFPAHGADFEALYKSADAAVYKAKKRGKNQLAFYDDRDKTPEEIAEADAHHISLERKSEG